MAIGPPPRPIACTAPGADDQSIHAGERFQVKRITVNPGAKLSLQKHYHRAEHWVVVNGTAIVTRDDEDILLRENEFDLRAARGACIVWRIRKSFD